MAKKAAQKTATIRKPAAKVKAPAKAKPAPAKNETAGEKPIPNTQPIATRKPDPLLFQFLNGKAPRPSGDIYTVALKLLRDMDAAGNYAPDALFTALTGDGEDPAKARDAVDKAIVQVRKDHGL